MINFSGLDSNTRSGRLLRWPLRLLPRNLTMRIWQGRLRGKRWIVGSSNHGCWLGSYEFEKQRLIVETVKPGTVFFDIGAQAGFYTLLAASLVGESGRVFAFEPLPRNRRYLEQHLKMNDVGNVEVFGVAVSDQPGEARFMEGRSASMGYLDEKGTVAVQTVSLDDLFSRGAIPLPDYLKVDVEGAELSVLHGARHLLAAGSPTVFLATHGSDVHDQCMSLLNSSGYVCRALDETKNVNVCDELVVMKRSI